MTIGPEKAALRGIGEALATLTCLKSFSYMAHLPIDNPHLASSVLHQLEHFRYSVSKGSQRSYGRALDVFRYLGPSCTKIELRFAKYIEVIQNIAENNAAVTNSVTDLTLTQVREVGLLHLLCDHFVSLQRLHIYFEDKDLSQNDGQDPVSLISSDTMAQLTKLTNLRVLILCHTIIDYHLFDSPPNNVLKCVEMFELGNLYLWEDDPMYELETFCKTFAKLMPNLRRLTVHSHEEQLQFTIEEMDKHLKLFDKLEHYDFS